MQRSVTVVDKKRMFVLPNNDGGQSNLHENYVPDWTLCFFLSFITRKYRSERFVLISIETFPALLRLALNQ